MKRIFLPLGLLVLLGGATIDALHTTSAMPQTYAADRQNGVQPLGITLFTPTTGRPVRRLTTNPLDGSPQVVDGDRIVYFLQAGGRSCSWALWRMPTSGGTPRLVRPDLSDTITMAVSRDGKMLAYETTGGGCRAQGQTMLTVEDLVTGRIHRIHDAEPVAALAWSPNDRDLAVEGYGGKRASSGVEVVKDVFAAKSFRPLTPVLCPLNAPYCSGMSPEYDSAGDLFYIAAIDPNFHHPCVVGVCQKQTYVLTELRGGHAEALAESVGIAGRVSYMTIDAAGNAAIYTVPHGSQVWETFRWSAGQVVPMSYSVEEESW